MSTLVLGQPKEIIKADNYYDSFNYNKALELFLDLEEQGGSSMYYFTHRIADCYRHIGNTKLSVDWYLKAIEFSEVDYSAYYVLALELRKLNRYDESDKYMEEYLDLSGKETQGLKLNSEQLIDRLLKDSLNYEIHSLGINSKFSDISPVVYNDKLIFTSDRKNISAIKRNDIRDGSGFYKIYKIGVNSVLNTDEVKLFENKLTTKYNDGPISFSKDFTIAFITRNVEASKDEKSYLNVFISYKRSDEWKPETTPVPLRQGNYSIMHGCLAQKDTRFYFASDMPGGFGGLDIYVSTYKNGFLSQPKNLGPAVNSEANEMFPFIDELGRLFYSSDKIGGLGGMDVFFSLPSKEGFIQSFNMGYPINTSYDDFSLIYDKVGQSGYFSSNRPGGIGKDDIYAFDQKRFPNYKYYSAIVKSKEGEVPIQGAEVKVISNGEVIVTKKTDKEGKISFFIDYNENLKLQVKKRYHDIYENKLSISYDSNGKEALNIISLEEY
ncbi:tetratricopeptide repeat protein [Labilibacter marinus]|uniref:tetratricopeptide repeat protein n=1 Tax=Labilibacter marinus TaxID=1477105 RepID=UPI00094F7859|nr:tetratricopeptide repeat protein [Labilibacter marinus]